KLATTRLPCRIQNVVAEFVRIRTVPCSHAPRGNTLPRRSASSLLISTCRAPPPIFHNFSLEKNLRKSGPVFPADRNVSNRATGPTLQHPHINLSARQFRTCRPLIPAELLALYQPLLFS